MEVAENIHRLGSKVVNFFAVIGDNGEMLRNEAAEPDARLVLPGHGEPFAGGACEAAERAREHGPT